MNSVWNNVRMFLWMTILTGIIYPLIITAIAQLAMKEKADGSIIYAKDQPMGAVLIAQKFESDKYFWPRPSAVDYNPLPSGGSNLGPTSAVLKKAVEERKEKIAKSQNIENDKVPSELLFASGSGLDPHIGVETAYFQIERIAKARGITDNEVKKLIEDLTINRSLGFLGDPCVNVLLLNTALDDISANQ